MTKIKIFDVDARFADPSGLESMVNEWIRNGKRQYDETGRGIRMVINVSTSGYATHVTIAHLAGPDTVDYTDHFVCTVLYEDVE